jgi:hypothetical protein
MAERARSNQEVIAGDSILARRRPVPTFSTASVKAGNAHSEHIEFALHPKADRSSLTVLTVIGPPTRLERNSAGDLTKYVTQLCQPFGTGCGRVFLVLAEGAFIPSQDTRELSAGHPPPGPLDDNPIAYGSRLRKRVVPEPSDNRGDEPDAYLRRVPFPVHDRHAVDLKGLRDVALEEPAFDAFLRCSPRVVGLLEKSFTFNPRRRTWIHGKKATRL